MCCSPHPRPFLPVISIIKGGASSIELEILGIRNAYESNLVQLFPKMKATIMRIWRCKSTKMRGGIHGGTFYPMTQ